MVATITGGSLGISEDEYVWLVAAGSVSVLGTFHLWADADKTVPLDLSGWTGRCQMRTKIGGPLLADAAVLIDGGDVTPMLPATASEGWSAKTTAGVFDVELVPDGDPDGTVRLCSGVVQVGPNSTTGQA